MTDLTPDKRAYQFIMGSKGAGMSLGESVRALEHEFKLAQNDMIEKICVELFDGNTWGDTPGSHIAEMVRRYKHQMKHSDDR